MALRFLTPEEEQDPEVRQLPDKYAVLEGDWGGQIFATIPLSMIKFGDEILMPITRYLNAIAWPSSVDDDVDMSLGVHYVHATPDDWFPAGCGGGKFVADEIWFHKEFNRVQRRKVRGWIQSGAEVPE
jgi:hypothetical protein